MAQLALTSPLVQISGSPPCPVVGAEETTLDVNGQNGNISWFDETQDKYAVQLLDSAQTVLVSEEHLSEWTPPSIADGGFDCVWSGDQLNLRDVGAEVISKLATQGWCLIECPKSKEIRAAALKQAGSFENFFTPKPELLPDYIGKGGAGKICFLEQPVPDETGEVPEDTLGAFEDEMDSICQQISKYTPDVLGFEGIGRRRVLAWMPYASRAEMSKLKAEPISDEDVEEGLLEEHLSFIRHRKVGLFWMVENEGGELHLEPSEEYDDLKPVNLPVSPNKMLIYRADIMTFSYKPNRLTESLVLQTWMLEEPPKLTCLSLVGDSETVSRAQGIDIGLPQPVGKRVNVKSISGKSCGGLYGFDHMLPMCAAGTDGFIKFPETRFDADLYCCDAHDRVVGKSYVVHSSMLPDDDCFNFDNAFFGISEKEVHHISTSHRMTLESAYKTLHASGYSKRTLSGANIGVYCGDTGSDFHSYSNGLRLYEQGMMDSDGNLIETMGKYTHGGMSQAITATRFSYCMNLKGPASQVDTACSASLVTFSMAAGDLRRSDTEQGDCHVARHTSEALAGGISVQVGPGSFIALCAGTMLSQDGRCKTFNETANGYARGEASAFAHLTYGESDEINQYRLACVVGLACNQDGRSANLTAPSGPAQQACIKMSMREAGLTARQISVAECHGTGTALGDPIEVGALRGVMEPRDTTLGSTSSKSHIGHMEACAGVIGFWKCVTMMQCSLGTPNIHLDILNSHLDIHGYPVWFHNEFYCTDQNAGVAGVSSFGFGGTNSRSDVYAQCRKGHLKTGDDFIDVTRKGIRQLFRVQCPVTLDDIDYLTGEPMDVLLNDKTRLNPDVLRDVLAPYDVSRHAYLGDYRFLAREPQDLHEADLLPEVKVFICGSWTGYVQLQEMERKGGGWYSFSMELGETRCENFFLCLDEDKDFRRIYPLVKNATPFIKTCGPDAEGQGKTWRIDGRDLQVPEGTAYKISFKWGKLHKQIKWEEDTVKVPRTSTYVRNYAVAASFTSWMPQPMKPVPGMKNTWDIEARFGATGAEQFKFFRDSDPDQAIYPTKVTNKTGVPVRGPDDMGKGKFFTAHGDVGQILRLQLTVIDAKVSIEAHVLNSDRQAKVWESIEGWDRHQYFVVGSWNAFSPVPMVMDSQRTGIFITRVKVPRDGSFQIWVDGDQQQAFYPTCDSAPLAKAITCGPDASGISPRKAWELRNIERSGPPAVFEIQLDLETADRRRRVTWFQVSAMSDKLALEA